MSSDDTVVTIEVDPQGPRGLKGDHGDIGAQGIQGLQGPQGPKGDTGSQGASAQPLVFQGGWNASAGTFPGGGVAQLGWFYVVTTAGTVNAVNFQVGDYLYAIINNAASGLYAGNWQKIDQQITSGIIATALGYTPASAARQISALGLATGGGDLTADRSITVTKSTPLQATTGTDDATAMTPARVKDAIVALATGATQGTDADIQAATAGAKYVGTANIASSCAPVSLVDDITVGVDWNTGINFSVTLTTSRILGNPSNGQPGTWRSVLVTQPAAGTAVLTFGNQFKFPAGVVPVIATGNGALTRLAIFCRTTSIFELYMMGAGLA